MSTKHVATPKMVSALYSLVGITEDEIAYESLESMSHGIGAKITKADETLASARNTLATLLPVALAYAFLTRMGGALSDRKAAPFLGVKPDTYAIYVIAGALASHGVDPFQARADVIAAVNGAGASKPVLLEAAITSPAAFAKVAKEAAKVRAERDAAKAVAKKGTEGTESETDPTEGAHAGDATETPATLGHKKVVALSGTLAGFVKAHHDGAITLTKEDRDALATAILALVRETKCLPLRETKVAAKTADVA